MLVFLALRALLDMTRSDHHQTGRHDMRNLPIDSNALRMLATGGVQAAPKWVEVNGQRSMAEGQQDTDDNGVPLWNVEAMVPAQSDRDRAEIVSVRIASYERPTVAELAPVAFEGLVCSVSVNKRTGAMGQYWGALKVADARPAKG
jgi:hypothetical protein